MPDAVKIRNETPINIWLGRPNQRQTLKPFETADYALPSGQSDTLIWEVPGASAPRNINKNSLPPALTIDVALMTSTMGPGNIDINQAFLNEVASLKQRGSNELRVTNATSQFATVWLLDPQGNRRIGEIAPGETWEHPSKLLLTWYFSTRSGEPLAMLAHPIPRLLPDPKPPFHITLTADFLDAWRASQAKKSEKDKRGLGPLKLIGEKRSSTPGPDDRIFISASTVGLDITGVDEPFNGLENREVRDVEIAGATLRWSSGNQILSGYYGENNAADIRSLSIFCDRMEVEDNLRFPRTNVTIYARELVFKGIGRIDTTPLPPAGRAKSKYLTNDPDDPTKTDVPADADGNPTYTAADGRKGEPGGDITVYAREAIADASGNGIRFICCGGKGQQGEAPGLKAYVRGDKQPESYGRLPIVTAADVKQKFDDVFKEVKCSSFRWPGNVDEPDKIVDEPDKIPNSPWKDNNVDVVSVSVFAYRLDALGFADLWRLYLRGDGSREHWGRLAEKWDGQDRNTSVQGCNGRDAYPGGWPGSGGNAGALKLITEKVDPNIAPCLFSPGEMGEPSEPLYGDVVKPSPVHVSLVIFDKNRVPEMRVLPRGGQQGKEAFGRAGKPRPVQRRDWMHVLDGYVVSNDGRVYYTRSNDAQRGREERSQKSDLSWAHPAAMAAVLSYARTAFRNGFREEAARALAPYQAVSAAQSGAVAQCSAEVRMAFASMTALYNNLVLDLDYYGNPAGWLPRLNALSNLSVLKTVREAAYETYYFADKMLREARELEDLRETAELAKAALGREMETARQQVKRAYDELPRALNKLNDVQKEVVRIGEEIAALRNEATIRSKDEATRQRFFSAALQLVDGIAKSVPIGQPFLGAAGSVFGAASKIDWTAEKPLETARTAIDDLGQQVTTFVTEKKDAVVAAVTSGLDGVSARNAALVTQLTREQEDAGEKAASEIEVTWQQVKSAELRRVESQITAIGAEIRNIRTRDPEKTDSDPEIAAANSFVTALRAQKDQLTPMGTAVWQRQLTGLRKQQFELINQARRDAKIKTKALREAALQAPPSLAQRLKAATRQSEDLTAKIAQKEATAGKAMAQLESLGTGLATVGNAIVTMATPISDADPTVQRLASQLLVSDPVLRQKGREFAQKLEAALAKKKQAATELMRWRQLAATSLDTVTRNLATMSHLSRQRQSIDLGLNPAAQAYLKQTRDAAKDALAESIYWFVKSYQYEFLGDVQDSFFNSDTWTTELQKQEEERRKQANSNAAQPASPGGVVTRATKILLTKEDLMAVGDKVFKAEQLKLGRGLLQERQNRAAPKVIKYTDCLLRRTDPLPPPDDAQYSSARRQNEMLDALARGEVVLFDFVRDFGKGSYNWNNARVSKVDLVKLEIETPIPTLGLAFRVEQRGDMVIAQKVGTDRHFYQFRPGSYSDPVGWTVGYNHQNKNQDSGIAQPTDPPDPLAGVARELLDPKLVFEEYQPSLFSDYVISITDLDENKKKELCIHELNMTVFIAHPG